MQVPGAATRDLLGLGSEKPGELPLEAQPRVLLDDALADRIGYLVAAEAEHVYGCAGREEISLGTGLEADAGGVVHGDRVCNELAVVGGHMVAVGELACDRGAANREVMSGTGLESPVSWNIAATYRSSRSNVIPCSDQALVACRATIFSHASLIVEDVKSKSMSIVRRAARCSPHARSQQIAQTRRSRRCVPRASSRRASRLHVVVPRGGFTHRK